MLLNKGPPGGLSRRLEISPEEGGASMWRLNYLNKDLDEWEEQISLELSRRFRLKMEMYLTKVLPMAMGWAEEKTMDGEEKANGMYYFDAFADKNKLGF